MRFGMRIPLLFSTLVLLWAGSVAAQTPGTEWTRVYWQPYGDLGSSVQQTSDGGYVITGYTWFPDEPYQDVYMIKTDAVGDTLWTRTYGGNGLEEGRWIEETSDGGYIIVGYTQASYDGDRDILLIRTDTGGDTLWTRTYGGLSADVGDCVKEVPGGYIVAGTTSSFGAGSSDVIVIRTDANGDSLWMRTFGGPAADHGFSVEQTHDQDFVVAGCTESFGAGGNDVYLIRLDASGDSLWTRTYGDTGNESGYAIERSPTGYVLAGSTTSSGAGGADVYLVGTDLDGDTLWTKTYGGPSDDYAGCIEITGDGGYLVVGNTMSFGAGDADIYVIRTDASGDTLWTRTYGFDWIDYGYAGEETYPDSGYIIIGSVSHWEMGEAIYLIKMGGAPSSVDPAARNTQVPACWVQPNPFTTATKISFSSHGGMHPLIAVYDISGRLVANLMSTATEDGRSAATWDGKSAAGRPMPAGTYFCKLTSAGDTGYLKLILIR